MVLYEFRDNQKLEFVAKELNSEPFANMDAEKSTKIKILTTLSSIYLAKAFSETDEKLRDELFREVRTYFNKSDKIEINEKSTFLLKGFYYFFQNEIKQSTDYFDNAKETDPSFVPCIIGRVIWNDAGLSRVRQKEIHRSQRPVQNRSQRQPKRTISDETGLGNLLPAVGRT